VLASQEMDAAVWTAIGLVAATSLGSLFYGGGRIDALAAHVDSRFDTMDSRIDALGARMDTRFDAMESRFDGLAARLDAHLDRHAG
jgi:flagellar capping protein FliD